MARVTYKPVDSADTITEVFGYVFEEGESIEVKNEEHLAKLKGNPEFSVSGTKAEDDSSAKERAKTEEKLSKVVDGRSKEARDARAKAQEAGQAASAKERAAEQAKAIREARQEAEDEKKAG